MELRWFCGVNIKWCLGWKFRKNMIWFPYLPTNRHRNSQITWTVVTVHVTCTQTALRVHENPCTALIPLYKNNFNFNLPMCSSFFLPCACLTYRKLIGLDKKMFHWRVETGLKNDFIKYFFLWGPWIVKIVNCFCTLVLSTCLNWELLIALLHRLLSFKKIRLPQCF